MGDAFSGHEIISFQQTWAGACFGFMKPAFLGSRLRLPRFFWSLASASLFSKASALWFTNASKLTKVKASASKLVKASAL